MTVSATDHPLLQLYSSLREADALLLPTDSSAGDVFPSDPSDMLRALCGSPAARAAIARTAQSWVPGKEQPAEPLHGLLVIPVTLPRSLAGGRFVVATLLAEALECETIDFLAQSAAVDGRLAKNLLAAGSPWDRRSGMRLVRLASALAQSESERLASAEAGMQLSAAWEELHLLHSISAEMALGASPMRFVTNVLSEVRNTIGCRWTALRVTGSAAQLLNLSNGGIVVEGIEPAAARRILDAVGNIARSSVVGEDLVVSSVRRDADPLGLLAAGDRTVGNGAMSSFERALVETAASNLAVFLDNARLYRDLDAMFLGALSALVSAIEAKDPYTRGHSQRVALVSRDLAAKAGLPDAAVKHVHIAGLVHDIGKIGVPEIVLRKQGRLDDAEYELIKQHPETGWRILRDIPQFAPILDGVRFHHERYDGHGYPHGLAGDDIPLAARIIAVADTFDAMSSTRTYRTARARSEVMGEMSRLGGTQFDPALLEHFMRLDFTTYDEMNAAHGAGVSDPWRKAA
jgi:HD-GYP domain-containing protein (c-di-GMP phosphodiesterase class II)